MPIETGSHSPQENGFSRKHWNGEASSNNNSEQLTEQPIDPREYYYSKSELDFTDSIPEDLKSAYGRFDKQLFHFGDEHIATSYSKDGDSQIFNLLINYTNENNESEWRKISVPTEQINEELELCISKASRRLPAETFLAKIQQLVDRLEHDDRPLNLLETTTALFGDQHDDVEINDEILRSTNLTDWTDNEGKTIDENQLKNYLSTIWRYVTEYYSTAEEQQKFMVEFKHNLQEHGDWYFYRTWAMYMDGWHLQNDPEGQLNYFEKDERKPARNFIAETKIGRTFYSADELENFLIQIPSIDLSKKVGRLETVNEYKLEMVPTDKIVALNASGNNFFIVDDNRDKKYLFEMAQSIQDRTFNPTKQQNIYFYEYDGEYYVADNGNHRSATMKALQIPQFPALVSHLTAENFKNFVGNEPVFSENPEPIINHSEVEEPPRIEEEIRTQKLADKIKKLFGW
ncbi:MAG: hypothetical protein LBG64_01645 [Pseudomonadales bacterium]|jgi:hypothetical protein|nr:hypothetical protein [Pseudomonadales bacterium]